MSTEAPHPRLLEEGLYSSYERIGGLYALVTGRIIQRALERSVEEVAAREDSHLRVGVVIQAQPQVLPVFTGQDRNKIIRGQQVQVFDEVSNTVASLQQQSHRPLDVVTLIPYSTKLDSAVEGQLKDTQIVRLDAGANHAEALNTGARALAGKADVMALTVAGATYATTEALKSAATSLEEEFVVQVSGAHIPGWKSSEAVVRHFVYAAMDRVQPRYPGHPLGEMPIDHAAYWRVKDVQDRPFDVAYGNGGADRAWYQGGERYAIVEAAASTIVRGSLSSQDIELLVDDWKIFSRPNIYISPSAIPDFPYDALGRLQPGRQPLQ